MDKGNSPALYEERSLLKEAWGGATEGTRFRHIYHALVPVGFGAAAAYFFPFGSGWGWVVVEAAIGLIVGLLLLTVVETVVLVPRRRLRRVKTAYAELQTEIESLQGEIDSMCSENYELHFAELLPDFFLRLDEAYRCWNETRDLEYSSWTELADQATWRASDDHVEPGDDADLLSFAGSVYDPNARDNVELRDNSTVPIEHWKRFHSLRQEMAHYLDGVGEQSSRLVETAEWAFRTFAKRPRPVKMILYLAIPLRRFTDGSGSMVNTGLGWFACRFAEQETGSATLSDPPSRRAPKLKGEKRHEHQHELLED